MAATTRCALAMAAALLLGGCAQQPPSEKSFNGPQALPYVNAHGLQVQVQIPRDGFVSASWVIDAKAAQAAAQTTDSITRSSVQAGGVVGLLVASAINTQTGTGVLERDARAAAQRDARPMAALLAEQAEADRLARRFRQASLDAGLPAGQGAITARLLIEPQLVLSADRGSFVLISRAQVQDIAGEPLYRRHIEVVGAPFRRCGAQCIDDGQLDLAAVDQQLQQCIEETLRVLAQDLRAGDSDDLGQQLTVRYVLDGQRQVERGWLLPALPVATGTATAGNQYHRYRNLDGALKSVPVPFENIATQ
ncbi:hypothetical protein SFA35_15645 [Pseudomonas sp. HR96]|uniref:hypothetical protein n=1 Tax=Pseudomonas sp. HR96 TaxID=1027966 RepID=UPI002A76478F|nr:hypothetical protein [Pseudomonas sp. HR96]WPO98083.1 hypothetical protein SFA35_15645 [Pseudomonas sp. HR96]